MPTLGCYSWSTKPMERAAREKKDYTKATSCCIFEAPVSEFTPKFTCPIPIIASPICTCRSKGSTEDGSDFKIISSCGLFPQNFRGTKNAFPACYRPTHRNECLSRKSKDIYIYINPLGAGVPGEPPAPRVYIYCLAILAISPNHHSSKRLQIHQFLVT